MIKARSRLLWLMLLVPLLFLWTEEAYPLSQGQVGGEVYGMEADATEPWPDELIPGTDFYVYNPTGDASYNYPLPPPPPFPSLTVGGIPTDSEIAGFADPGVLSPSTFDSGAYARAQSERTANVTSSLGNYFTVLAGTSGLNFGEATTVTIQLRLDGMTEVEGGRYNSDGSYNNYSSWVDVSSRFRVWDPTIEICGEGCMNPYLVDFDMDMNHQESASWGYIYNQYSGNWSVDTWNGATESYDTLFSDNYNDWWELEHNQYGVCYGSPEAEFGCGGRGFDTGLLSITFDTYVGAELYYFGRTNVFSQARGNNSYAIGDFLSTMGGTVTPGDPGIELSFLLAPPPQEPGPPPPESGGGGTKQVPEPSTLFLLGSGLAGLGFVRRRFKR